MKVVLRSVFIIFLALSVIVPDAYADIATISVRPTVKRVNLSQGETKSGVFVVFNHADRQQHVSVRSGYWYSPEYKKDLPLNKWLRLSPAEFDVPVGGKQEVSYEVLAPEDAQGEFAAKISFHPRPEEDQAVNVIFSVSLYVKIKGAERIEHKINDFKIWNIKDRNALGANVVIKNIGNVHLRPKITVFVEDLFGKALQKAPLEFGTPIYPQSAKEYKGAIYNFSLKPGLYKAVIHMEYADAGGVFRKKVYFLVGKGGRIWLTFFRKPKE